LTSAPCLIGYEPIKGYMPIASLFLLLHIASASPGSRFTSAI
jgi:hypothetical protein